MFRTDVPAKTSSKPSEYLFIGHPRHSFVQALHSALNPHETLALTMRSDSKLLDPKLKYSLYILDVDYFEDAPAMIRSIRRHSPQARILAIGKNPHWETVREVLRAGAVDMLSAPSSTSATVQLLEQIVTYPLPGDCRV